MIRGQRNRINLGSSIFRSFIEKDALFVDKSAFIEHVLEDFSGVLLFTRPRRMGKSLNLDMLRSFIDCKQDAVSEGLFKGLYIEGSPVFGQAGSAPVVYLNMRDINRDGYKARFLKKMRGQSEVYLSKDQQTENLVDSLSGNQGTFTDALRDLIENLYAVCGTKPFVLIDEYDKLIMDSVGTPVFDEIRDFTKAMLSSALKDNPALGKGVLTGVNRIAQESMFSDLNNLKVYDVLTPSAFDTDFGFSEQEAIELCTPDELATVREWYNGYRIGSSKIYFTYSVMSYLDSGLLANYWGRSGTVAMVKQHLTTDRIETITSLINGFGGSETASQAHKGAAAGDSAGKTDDNSEATPVGARTERPPILANIKDRLSAEDLSGFATDSSFYSLLVQTGYLTWDGKPYSGQYELSLPNRELVSVWREFILEDVLNLQESSISNVFQALSDPKYFSSKFTDLISNRLSYFDFEAREPERTYHAFVAGLLAAAKIPFASNRESGFGRYDIMAFLADKTVVFEFKVATVPGPTADVGNVAPTPTPDALQAAAEGAITQITERNYAADAPAGKPVYAVGIGFCGKLCAVAAMPL
jgi:hypothetical protein